MNMCSCGDAGTVQAQARLRLLLEPSYAVLEFELASALHCIINSHWKRLLQNAAFRPTVQVHLYQTLAFDPLCTQPWMGLSVMLRPQLSMHILLPSAAFARRDRPLL